MRDELLMYTIYRNPRDFPGEFVARVHAIGRQGVQARPELFARGFTLAQVRARLPGGLFNIGREPADDPVIVETWL
jgi:hypothetical protein